MTRLCLRYFETILSVWIRLARNRVWTFVCNRVTEQSLADRWLVEQGALGAATLALRTTWSLLTVVKCELEEGKSPQTLPARSLTHNLKRNLEFLDSTWWIIDIFLRLNSIFPQYFHMLELHNVTQQCGLHLDYQVALYKSLFFRVRIDVTLLFVMSKSLLLIIIIIIIHINSLTVIPIMYDIERWIQ